MFDPFSYNASFVWFDANLKHKSSSVLRRNSKDCNKIILKLFRSLLSRHNQWHVCIRQAHEVTPSWIFAKGKRRECACPEKDHRKPNTLLKKRKERKNAKIYMQSYVCYFRKIVFELLYVAVVEIFHKLTFFLVWVIFEFSRLGFLCCLLIKACLTTSSHKQQQKDQLFAAKCHLKRRKGREKRRRRRMVILEYCILTQKS